MDFAWTDEAIETLRRLRAERLSFSHIGEQIGCSRNACIGKALRIGIPRLAGGKKVRPRPRTRPEPKPPQVMRMRIIRGGVAGSLRLVETPEAFEAQVSSLSPDDIPVSQRKQLFDLNHDDCRWPYGDPGTPSFFFCGATAVSEKSYCAFHQSVARGSSPKFSGSIIPPKRHAA